MFSQGGEAAPNPHKRLRFKAAQVWIYRTSCSREGAFPIFSNMRILSLQSVVGETPHPPSLLSTSHCLRELLPNQSLRALCAPLGGVLAYPAIIQALYHSICDSRHSGRETRGMSGAQCAPTRRKHNWVWPHVLKQARLAAVVASGLGFTSCQDVERHLKR